MQQMWMRRFKWRKVNIPPLIFHTHTHTLVSNYNHNLFGEVFPKPTSPVRGNELDFTVLGVCTALVLLFHFISSVVKNRHASLNVMKVCLNF